MNRANEAITDFDAAIDLGKTSPITFFGRGKAYEKLGSLEEAIADYKVCIEMRAENQTDRNAQEKARAKLNDLSAMNRARASRSTCPQSLIWQR